MLVPEPLLGAWSGEGIACAAPRERLHLFRRERTFHPRILDDDVGYACVVINVRGRAPDYRVRLRCRAFGQSSDRRVRPVMQIARLSEAGRRLEVDMFDTSDGTPLRREHLYRCSGADTPERRPLRQD